jgi:xanthine dehydrogenase small subunit
VRDFVLLYINGRRHQVAGADCFLSLSDYLRQRCGLVGTKIVCSEGDCGACTVLIGRPNGDRLSYLPVDSCIQFIFQLDGTHVVTVEGLERNGVLTPVQDAMIRCHGSQCGYCTPGFVVAMTGLLESRQRLDEDCLRRGLSGNLCRCTGYVPILDAGRELETTAVHRMNEFYQPEPMLQEFRRAEDDTIGVVDARIERTRNFYGPASLSSALELVGRYPDAKVVAGATDLGVQLNKRMIDPDVLIDLNRVPELTGVSIEHGQIVAGSRTTWTELEDLCRHAVPEFYRIIAVFGAPQIRHVGTLGGNVINGSPIADSLPFLFVTEAELELQSGMGSRTVKITDFYQGYKKFDLRPDELLTRLRIPLPTENQKLRLYKVSRRRDLDISTFTAALLVESDGETIRTARLAFGGVGPMVIRARRAEAFLRNRKWDEATVRQAGEIAVTEISPITDVRGSEEFRRQLTRNVLLRFYHENVMVAVQR